MSLFATPGAARLAALLLSRGDRPDPACSELTVVVLDLPEGALTVNVLDTREGVLDVARRAVQEIMRVEPLAAGVLSADVRHACTLVECEVRVLVARK